MKTLLLLRHGKSSWDDPEVADFDRPLSKRGRKAARAMGQVLADRQLAPDLVLCSESLRTQETWEIASREITSRAVSGPPPVRLLRALYLASPAQILKAVGQAPDSVGTLLAVGHNPGFEDLARRLAGPGSNPEAVRLLGQKFPTGALAILVSEVETWAALTPANTRLIAFLRPREVLAD